MSNEDTLRALGRLIDGPAERDAVHIAVAPVIAGQKLDRGDHVGLVDGRAFLQPDGIGIVDPFLGRGPLEGERFWLFLLPGSITSLRHEWTHPALPTKEAALRSDSERWMRAWALEHVSDDYYGEAGAKLSEEAAYAFALDAGRRLFVGPYEDARDYIDAEWWRHWEAITGERGQPGEFFSCAC